MKRLLSGNLAGRRTESATEGTTEGASPACGAAQSPHERGVLR